MSGYRLWHVDGRSYDVRIQAGDQVLGREGLPGAYVWNTGNLACLNADDLEHLSRAASAAAVDVRERETRQAEECSG